MDINRKRGMIKLNLPAHRCGGLRLLQSCFCSFYLLFQQFLLQSSQLILQSYSILKNRHHGTMSGRMHRCAIRICLSLISCGGVEYISLTLPRSSDLFVCASYHCVGSLDVSLVSCIHQAFYVSCTRIHPSYLCSTSTIPY